MLIVGNGLNICKGTISRKRVTKNSVEQSVIDIVLFSGDMLDSLVSLDVDEEKKVCTNKSYKS